MKYNYRIWGVLVAVAVILATFRFEDENDYGYKIWLKVFSRILKS